MNYFELVKNILNTAGKHKYIHEVYYGDVYEFENQSNRKYSNFCLSVQNTVTNGDITTYTFNAFVTDRLTDDRSNLLEVQSLSKTILEQILAECFDSLDSTTYTFWTEKFNDICAGCYVNFSVSLPKELVCADDNLFDKVIKDINENGTYNVQNVDEVNVNVSKINYYCLSIAGNFVGDVTDIISLKYYNSYYMTNFAKGQKYMTSINIIDAGNVETSTDYMDDMFNGCSSLKSISIDELQKTCIRMFNGCSSLENISLGDYSKVERCYNMFSGCSSLKNISLGDFPELTTAYSMFNGCSSLKSATIGDCPKLTTAYSMFNGCSSLKSVSFGNFNNVDGVRANSMFFRCDNFEDLHVESMCVTNASYMFGQCPKLKTIPSNIDFSKCTNISYMFNSDIALEYIPLVDFGSVNTGCYNWLFQTSWYVSILKIDGLKDLGKGFTSKQTLSFEYKNVLDSVDNIANTVYDMNLNPNIQTATVKFTSYVYDNLTDEQKNLFSSKGWTVTTI